MAFEDWHLENHPYTIRALEEGAFDPAYAGMKDLPVTMTALDNLTDAPTTGIRTPISFGGK